MPKRTIIFLVIFITVFILAGIFVFVYQNYSRDLLVKYFENNDRCAGISDEQECHQHDYCEGIYDKESKFKYCQIVSDKILTMIEIEKELCQNTGGKWYRNKLGNFCLCQNSHKFDKIQGCINK